MSKVSRSCPVCLHTDAVPVYENKMAAVAGFDMSYSVGCCRKCGFFFATTLADDLTFQRYYQSVSKYDVAGKISVLDQFRIDAAVNFCRDKIPFDAMVIDLGCGYGALLSGMKSAGWDDLHGVDPAPNSADRARELFGLEGIYCGTMAEAENSVSLARADLVCITAVLEHLPNLRTEVSGLLGKIRPGCRILVEVPALECFSGVNSEPLGELSLEHIQFFSTISLKNLFLSLGAIPLAMTLVEIPALASGTLFGLFEWTGQFPSTPVELLPDGGCAMYRYIAESENRLHQALARIPDKPLVIYGAGSHTARLLPQLEKMAGKEIVAVVDNNPNLLNKQIGQWTIQSPAIIGTIPDTYIVVSSFRSQNEIAASLRARYPNPVVLLYE